MGKAVFDREIRKNLETDSYITKNTRFKQSVKKISFNK